MLQERFLVVESDFGEGDVTEPLVPVLWSNTTHCGYTGWSIAHDIAVQVRCTAANSHKSYDSVHIFDAVESGEQLITL